jgi:prevent-host-death family protein
MKRATITEAKNQLSAILDRVQAGESILITDRGVAVARLEPVAAHPDQTDRVERLERAGIVRRGVAPLSLDLLRRPAPKLGRGVSAVEALLEERRTGR